MFDVRYAGFWGYYYNTQYNGETPGWYDVDEDFYGVNSYYFYKADRVRNQVNATVTKFASGFDMPLESGPPWASFHQLSLMPLAQRDGDRSTAEGNRERRSYLRTRWGPE